MNTFAIAVTSSRYYVRVPSLAAENRQNQDFQDLRIIRIGAFRDGNLPILINHKIPQILILTIHGSVYAGLVPFRDGNLPILINHKIPQILILTIHGSVYA